MMRVLVDVIRPTGGEVRVLGVSPRSGGPSLRRRIGYLPGDLAMEERISARSLLAHLGELNGIRTTGRVDELAERLGLDLSRSVRSLSKGNKQKVGLVQAFAHRPELLILDEPTSGLDPLIQQEFLALVREARDEGQTVFLSSHVMSEIGHAADDVAVLRDGRIVEVSSVAQLRETARRDVRVAVHATEEEVLVARLRGLGTLHDIQSRRDGDVAVITAHLADGISGFLAALATVDVRDLVIDEPDLERVVLGLYAAAHETVDVDEDAP
jgi:ABC-2 type transport system ATP-binding protein